MASVSPSAAVMAQGGGGGGGGELGGRSRHGRRSGSRHRGHPAQVRSSSSAGGCQKYWPGPEQRDELLRRVPQCVREQDRRELMALLRQKPIQRREAGLDNPQDTTSIYRNNNTTTTTKITDKWELTLLQGACLLGASVDMVASLLVNGASPNIPTHVVLSPGQPQAKSGTRRSVRRKNGGAVGGFTPLHLALIGGGRERNKIVRELLVYGADVEITDATGFSFLDLTDADDAAYSALRPVISQAAKDPRAKKAQEASRALQEVWRLAVQRETEKKENGVVTLIDPLDILPPELSIHILSFLSLAQLVRASMVSALWRCIATDHDLWRKLYLEQLGPVPPDAEHNFQALLQRELTLKAKFEAKMRLQERRLAKLLVQIISHPDCDHSSHHHQISVRTIPGWNVHRSYYTNGSSVVCALDTRSRDIRTSQAGEKTINDYLDTAITRVTHSATECKVRCMNLSGRRKTYNLKVGDKLGVIHYRPQNGTCRVLFFSLTLDVDDDHLVPPSFWHYYNC